MSARVHVGPAPGLDRDGSRQPAASRSRAADAYGYVKDRIISLEMPPGSSFVEADIAKALGTSKTPIREALVRLEHEGLVTSTPRSSYQVAPITLKDTRELDELRGILQIEAVARAAARGLAAQEIQPIEESLAALEAIDMEAGPSAIVEFERLIREFDLSIARASGNDRLCTTLEGIYDELRRVRLLGVRLGLDLEPNALTLHRDIVDAIKRPDPNAARAAMRERFERGSQHLLSALAGSASIMSVNIGVPVDHPR